MLHKLNDIFPVRYTVFGLCVLALLLSLATLPLRGAGGVMLVLLLPLVALGIYDMAQSKRSILRNYPVIGHIRYMLEFVRPELRQYFLESDNEATPFSRAQRSLVYQRAKGESDKRPFGTLL
ncbi:MAG: FMN-binding glutamate synthase family protein, partial [Rhodoferax sp.]|nr:FMN-binding glutamate synthase family protein [Rhodoferax sp.]